MYLYLIIVGLFWIGAAVGSFLNVVIDRGNLKESFLIGRSHCDHCKSVLQVSDLIPVLSYIFLRGKCRYCKNKLSYYYPITETLTGILFVFIVFNLSPNFFEIDIAGQIFMVIALLSMVLSLVVIFFTDLKFGIIPFSPVLIALAASLTMHLVFPADNTTMLNYLLSGVILFTFFLSIFLVTRGKGMGFGDVIYAFLMGFILGYPRVILGFYIAVLSGAVIPIIILILKKKKIRGATIPFGPFLVAGTIIGLFWGHEIIKEVLYLLLY